MEPYYVPFLSTGPECGHILCIIPKFDGLDDSQIHFSWNFGLGVELFKTCSFWSAIMRLASSALCETLRFTWEESFLPVTAAWFFAVFIHVYRTMQSGSLLWHVYSAISAAPSDDISRCSVCKLYRRPESILQEWTLLLSEHHASCRAAHRLSRGLWRNNSDRAESRDAWRQPRHCVGCHRIVRLSSCSRASMLSDSTSSRCSLPAPVRAVVAIALSVVFWPASVVRQLSATGQSACSVSFMGVSWRIAGAATEPLCRR